MSSDTYPGTPVTLADSGLVVPAGVVGPGKLANDADGRRRLVLSDDERRTLDRAIKLLKLHGLGVIVGCLGTHGKTGQRGNGFHRDGRAVCGEALRPEGEGTRDQGYGCSCTRVHFW